jgi:hypothetical protein
MPQLNKPTRQMIFKSLYIACFALCDQIWGEEISRTYKKTKSYKGT